MSRETKIDSQICRAEQSIHRELSSLKRKYNIEASDLHSLEATLQEYQNSVRLLRCNLEHLERNKHQSSTKTAAIDSRKDLIAYQIQKETHESPVTFTDFVKSLLMWRDTPDDRM